MPATDQEQAVADRLDRFATAYAMLARLFGAPVDAELFAFLAQPGQLDAWPMDPDASTVAGLESLRAALASEDVAAIAYDYQLLFIGPGRPRAVPYESVYRSKEGLLFEEQTFDVRRAYEAFGLVAPALNREPDDHIALEFSFLAHLCITALDAMDLGDDLTVDRCLAAEQAFLRDHVSQWVPTVLEAMLKNAESAFYRGVAQVAQGVVVQGTMAE